MWVNVLIKDFRPKKTRGYTRRRQNLEAKARTKKEQAELAALDQELAEARKDYWDYQHKWTLMNIRREHACDGKWFSMQKSRALSDCCVTLVVSGKCVCGTCLSGVFVVLAVILSAVSPSQL